MHDPLTPAILFSQMEPPAGRSSDFHEWYETDHIPARMALPGFSGARRYRALQGSPDYLAIYELDTLDALTTDGYRALKTTPSAVTEEMLSIVNGFTRYTLRQIEDAGSRETGDYLSAVAFAVPDEHVAEFDEWYGGEHVPMLLEADDWLRVRRYRVVSGEGGPWTHFALHELRTLDVMESPERARARSGPLRERLADQPWFGRSGRWLYERISTHASPSRLASSIPGVTDVA
ncbi:hypothetical protein N1027_14065 [Herbiconiux sp. CPCC 205763]|uniref:EthD domain-containing protein n=1 Tax=Herbiconiux aconitum TaxID=2970913 RepID=A0ABT2GST9_9MICO|nr:DUF4286 family protein [Herbiconiux aconitum]MCS5719260.1 hypothetical protein [Herbiconiux aconitum]